MPVESRPTKFNNFLHKWKNEKDPDKLLHPNTIEVQLNIFKTLVNRAIDLGYMSADKKEEVLEMLKGMSPEEIAAIMQAINK